MCGFNKMVPQRTLQSESMTIVRNMFPRYLISRFGDLPWLPSSPDLSNFDFFFLCGGIWNRVFTLNKPRTLNDLKEVIRQEIRPIDRQILARVMDDFLKKKKRLENCIQEDGRHFTDIIFKI